MTRPIYINGKFAAQRTTGVQRFARELVQALDCLLLEEPAPPRIVLLTPPGAAALPLAVIEQQTITCPIAGLHAWEQLALPFAARRGLLLNLTGSAPFSHFRQVASILDTAIYRYPEAYTRPFVTWYRQLFAYQARYARLIVTLTEFTRQELVNILRPRAPVIVVGAGAGSFATLAADRAAMAKYGLGSTRYMLAVGSSNPTKNLDRLQNAFDTVRDPELRLVIAGGGNQHVFRPQQHGGSDKVVRSGTVTDAELKTLYEHARGLIFPSLYEGFGLPPLEAMVCSCPVAASQSASIPEVCGDAALYFDPHDTGAITAAIDQLNDDAAMRKMLIDAGHQRAGLFTWRKAAAILWLALQDVRW